MFKIRDLIVHLLKNKTEKVQQKKIFVEFVFFYKKKILKHPPSITLSKWNINNDIKLLLASGQEAALRA